MPGYVVDEFLPREPEACFGRSSAMRLSIPFLVGFAGQSIVFPPMASPDLLRTGMMEPDCSVDAMAAAQSPSMGNMWLCFVQLVPSFLFFLLPLLLGIFYLSLSKLQVVYPFVYLPTYTANCFQDWLEPLLPTNIFWGCSKPSYCRFPFEAPLVQPEVPCQASHFHWKAPSICTYD